jgi:hypothetical protein
MATLDDGFRELASYDGHKLPLKGMVLIDEATMTANTTVDSFITWDMKQTHIWKYDRIAGIATRLRRLKFSSEKQHYVISVAYIQKLRMFLMSTSDHTFRLYDRELNFLESIRHEERAVLNVTFVDTEDILLVSGSEGVSAWNVYRKVTPKQTFFVIEKAYTFGELKGIWVGKLTYEMETRCAYAFVENSVYVLSVEKKKMVHLLLQIHDDPVTACIWYDR